MSSERLAGVHCSLVAHALVLAHWVLAPGQGGLGAVTRGSRPPWEGLAQRSDAGATMESELPYPGRSAPRRLRAVNSLRRRCVARLGLPAVRRPALLGRCEGAVPAKCACAL